MKRSLIMEIATTWEICGGRELSEAAKDSVTEALEGFDPASVRKALGRCAAECRGNISLADIIQRIDDGRPGPDEAWAMIPKTEDESAVWTAEMAEAYGVVSQMKDDPIAARMAFKEAYLRICSEARFSHKPITWIYSPGFDKSTRAAALLEAVEKKRLTAERAYELEPHLVETPLKERGLLEAKEAPMLPIHEPELDEDGMVSQEEIGGFLDTFSKLMDVRERGEREKMREKLAKQQDSEEALDRR
jgi:hypothetical protein